MDAVSHWMVETSGLGPRSLAARVRLGRRPRDSLRTLLKVFPVHRARAVRTWNLCIISSVLASGSHCSGRLGIAEELILREMTFLRECNAWFSVDICSASVLWWLWKNLYSFYVMADSFPDALLLHSA